MASEFTLYFSTHLGNLKLEFQEKKLRVLSIADETVAKEKLLSDKEMDKASKNTLQQLKIYFSSAISFSSIDLAPQGTHFQRAVWRELSNIPFGETRTYGEIAKILHSSPRAVGNACRKNPIQIIVPCHRVVSAKGIGGYAGETQGKQLKIKRWLLEHEGVAL